MLTIKNRVRNNFSIFLTVVTLLTGCTPPGPRALLEGKRLLDQGNYSQAVEKLKTATTLLSTNALAWNYLGLAYHQAGQLTEADGAYRRALGFDRDLTEARYNLGCLFLEQNKVDDARAQFTAFTLRRSNSVEGLLKLGLAQWRSRDVTGAERSFGEALRLSAQNPEALNGLGLTRLQRGRPNEAVQFFSSAIKEHPDYRPALLNLAVVEHQYLRDRPAALKAYRDYLALKPAPPEAEALSAVIRQLEQEINPQSRPVVPNVVAQASTNANTVKPVAPATNVTRLAAVAKPEPAPNPPKPLPATNLPKPSVVAASAPAPAPRPVETVKLADEPAFKTAQDVSSTPARAKNEALGSSPGSPALRTPVADAKASKRGFLKTINPLNLFHGEDKSPARTTPLPLGAEPSQVDSSAPVDTRPDATVPAKVEARYAYKSPPKPAAGSRAEAQKVFAKGVKAQEARQFSEAVQSYRKATQADPSFFEAHYNLGLVNMQSGNLPQALAAYESALAVQPSSLDARYNFALALQQANYLADAVNEFEKVLAAYPNESRAHLALANLYAQQFHQPARARSHYLKVLELEPRHPQASAIRYWLAANP